MMSVGKVDVWIPDAFNGYCKIDKKNHFVATVQNCDGSVVEWSGGRYQTNDGQWHPVKGDVHGEKPGVSGYYDGVPGTGDPGHITFELPPGCYLVTASTHVWIKPEPYDASELVVANPVITTMAKKSLLLGNLATHKAIIRVDCAKETCVTLFQPSGFHCSAIMTVGILLPVMKEQRLITAEQFAAAEKALAPVMEKLAKSPLDAKEEVMAKMIVRRLTRKDRVK
jgi:hypothetical protein